MIWHHPQVLSPGDATDGIRRRPSEALRLLEQYPPSLPDGYAYGTAGFRYDASVMEAVLVRVAVFCVWWYPRVQDNNANNNNTLGIMVTASHNDESYNGVKLVQANGEILADPVVQKELTEWVNSDLDQTSGGVHPIRQWLIELAEKESNNNDAVSNTARIHIGHDTRSHSPALTRLAIETIRALRGIVYHHGVATTPLLHHVVFHANPHQVPSLVPLRPNAVGYYHELAWSYYNLLLTGDATTTPQRKLLVDCACGVGYPSLVVFHQVLKSILPRQSPASSSTVVTPRFLLMNGPSHGPLNENCGSEFVQKSLQPPEWHQQSNKEEDDNDNQQLMVAPDDSWEYSCSLDGDADRIVFFSSNQSNNNFFLLDGDKIAVLICEFLQAQVADLSQHCSSLGTLKLGAVQTAYANGASTRYLQRVLGQDNVLIAKTGVQHVHHAAKSFDVGVYFEANGHGTVVFGPKFYSYLARAEAYFMESSASRPASLQRLRLLPSLINQAVGDALSDLLLVDAILYLQGWDLSKWNALYADRPSKMTKLKVNDRSVVKTNDNDTVCLEPRQVQPELEKAMKECNGRCFVRPSGTEDVVRVYAEAETRQQADELSRKAERIVHELCGGIGDPPSVFPASKI